MVGDDTVNAVEKLSALGYRQPMEFEESLANSFQPAHVSRRIKLQCDTVGHTVT